MNTVGDEREVDRQKKTIEDEKLSKSLGAAIDVGGKGRRSSAETRKEEMGICTNQT